RAPWSSCISPRSQAILRTSISNHALQLLWLVSPGSCTHLQANTRVVVSMWHKSCGPFLLGRPTPSFKWVQHCAPILEKKCRSKLKPTCDSWRVGETYFKVKGN